MNTSTKPTGEREVRRYHVYSDDMLHSDRRLGGTIAGGVRHTIVLATDYDSLASAHAALVKERELMQSTISALGKNVQELREERDSLRAKLQAAERNMRFMRGLVKEREAAGNDIPPWLALEWIDAALAAGEPERQNTQSVTDSIDSPQPPP